MKIVKTKHKDIISTIGQRHLTLRALPDTMLAADEDALFQDHSFGVVLFQFLVHNPQMILSFLPTGRLDFQFNFIIIFKHIFHFAAVFTEKKIFNLFVFM